jgi:hypothetical protein
MYGMGCQYSTRGLVSSEKHETPSKAGAEEGRGDAAEVMPIAAAVGSYRVLPDSLAVIIRLANSAKV